MNLDLEAAYPQFSSFILYTSSFPSKEEFLREVPRLIIEHNIHGIDIDPRAAQIAGLALWLRAQKAWQRLDLEKAKRPVIKRSNIVCAEPMPGEKELLREFVEREFLAAERGVCLRLLEAIFDKMQLAGEAGSLLKIEEEIRSAIEDARRDWEKIGEHLPGLATDNPTSDLRPLTSDSDPRHLTTDFWERIEERIYAALRDYAEQAENGGGFQRRLFAEDAARGFAFIDVCRKRYDVVVMNPPFGAPTVATVEFLATQYSAIKTDLYGAFVENALDRLFDAGCAGAITSRTGFFLASFQKWREQIVLPRAEMEVMIDLGGGVLDTAMVETAAYVLKKNPHPLHLGTVFIRLSDYEDKGQALAKVLGAGIIEDDRSNVFVRSIAAFSKLPKSPLCYWIPDRVLNIVLQSRPFEPSWGRVLVGVQTDNDTRFVRNWIENPSQSIGASLEDTNLGRGWVAFLKGDSTSPFYFDHDLTLNWFDNGSELRAATELAPGGRVNNEEFYYKPGISWALRTDYFAPHIVPAGCIPSVSRYEAVPNENSASNRLVLVALLSAPIYDFIAKLQMEKWKQPKFIPGVIRNLPLPDIEPSLRQSLEAHGSRALDCARLLHSSAETSRIFTRAISKSLTTGSLKDAGAAYAGFLHDHCQELERISAKLGSDVDAAFGLNPGEVNWLQFLESDEQDESYIPVSPLAALLKRFPDEIHEFVEGIISWTMGIAFGRWDIRYATGEQAAPELPDPFAPLPVCPPGQLQNAQGLPACPEDVPAAYPVRIPWDGILVDDPNHPLDIERRVRDVIEIIWSGKEGGPTAEAIEHEACEILGVKSLRDYFRKPAGFFADHLKRYSKSRRQAPIYWPISTASGSYTLWIYYHRLTPDTLYKCLQQFVEPKIKDVEQEIHRLRTMLDSNEGGTKERDQLKNAETFLNELKELYAELSLWAPKWKPNLNDGVLITASPLWKLFRLPKWRTALEACWKDLNAGDYDWAHLAHTLWPARVREKCKTDRSLAIAHGLEDLYEVKAPEPKKKATKKAAARRSKNSGSETPNLPNQ